MRCSLDLDQRIKITHQGDIESPRLEISVLHPRSKSLVGQNNLLNTMTSKELLKYISQQGSSLYQYQRCCCWFAISLLLLVQKKKEFLSKCSRLLRGEKVTHLHECDGPLKRHMQNHHRQVLRQVVFNQTIQCVCIVKVKLTHICTLNGNEKIMN